MTFYNELSIKSIRSTDQYEVSVPLVYGTNINEKTEFIVIPQGFRTNFASIPRCCKWFIDNDSPIIRDAAVVHDYLYSSQSTAEYSHFDREQIDLILAEAMLELGAPTYKTALVYWMVRLFGGLHYKTGD